MLTANKISSAVAAITMLALLGTQADAAGIQDNQGQDRSNRQSKNTQSQRVQVTQANPSQYAPGHYRRTPPQPVFTPQRHRPVARWQSPPPRMTPTLRQQPYVLHLGSNNEPSPRVTTAAPTMRRIQRITLPQQTQEGRRVYPTVPQTFNFAGRNSQFFSNNIRQGTSFLHPQSAPTQPWFSDRVTRNSDGFRIGFVQYDSGFHQSSFYFGNYAYWPYSPCVASPWYFYPMLPPYISLSFVYTEYPPSWSDSYHPYNGYVPGSGHRYGSLDYCIDDLRVAYIEHDPRAINRLIPRYGDIAIYIDGDYRYSVRCSDFHEMLEDSISDVRTTGYRVIAVRRYDDGSVLIESRHTFSDGWNGGETVYQSFRLVPQGSTYVIREFGTSQRRIYD